MCWFEWPEFEARVSALQRVHMQLLTEKVEYDHRSKFSNLSNWKEKSGLQRDSNPWPPRIRYSRRSRGSKFQASAMIIPHIHQQPQFKYQLFHINFIDTNGAYQVAHITCAQFPPPPVVEQYWDVESSA